MCNLPPNTFKHLPLLMFGVNLIILICIAIAHGKYHMLFDTASVIAPLIVGILVGAGFGVFSIIRSCHTDGHSLVTKPLGLLELLQQKKQEETNDHEESTAHQHNTQWGAFFTPSVEPRSATLLSYTENENSSDDLLKHGYG